MKDDDKTREQLIRELEAARLEGTQMDEQLRALKRAVENMQLGVTITDTQGKILYTNPAEARMHGYSEEELIGKDARILAPREYGRPMTREEMRRIRSWTREGINIRKEGGLFPVKLMSDLVTDEKGAPVAIITTCEDITERKRQDEELKKYRESLQALVEERTQEVSETAMRLLKEAGERKRAESTLKDLNARLQTLIQAIPDVVFFKDAQFRYLVVNKAFEEFTGKRQEELLGKTDGELLPPDLADFCKKSDEEVVRRHTPLHFEEQTVTGAGERRYFDTVKGPIYDDGGNIVGLVGVSRDMTERKRAEKLIRESQERYMNLVELATDIIYISDNNGNQVFMNDAAFKILGYSPEEVIGRPFINLIHPDDREKTFKKRKEMSERGIDVFNFENRYRTKNGRAINVLHNVRVLRNEKGEFVGTQGIARDITERKRAEEKLKLYSRALEEAMDGIQIVDLDGHIVYSNKSVEEIYGFSADELIGKHVNEMNVDKEFASKVILPGIRMAGRWDGELMVVHKSGRQFPIWLSTSLVKNTGGEPIAMVGIIRDITDRRRAAEEREEMIAELQDALANIKTLKGLLPICASCKKIRDDKGYWNQIEAYIRDHTDADFSHGICPECQKKLYPDL